MPAPMDLLRKKSLPYSGIAVPTQPVDTMVRKSLVIQEGLCAPLLNQSGLFAARLLCPRNLRAGSRHRDWVDAIGFGFGVSCERVG